MKSEKVATTDIAVLSTELPIQIFTKISDLRAIPLILGMEGLMFNLLTLDDRRGLL